MLQWEFLGPITNHNLGKLNLPIMTLTSWSCDSDEEVLLIQGIVHHMFLFQILTSSVIWNCWWHISNFTYVIMLLIFVIYKGFCILLYYYFFKSEGNFECNWKIWHTEVNKWMAMRGLTHISILTNHISISSVNQKGVIAHSITYISVWQLNKFHTANNMFTILHSKWAFENAKKGIMGCLLFTQNKR